MGLFSALDIVHGDLPPWLNNFVALTRPLTTSAIIAIPAVGAFSVGVVAGMDYQMAWNMMVVSTKFLQGVPDAAYGMVTAIALGYTAGKSVEAIKAPASAGGTSPEAGPNATTAPVEIDAAPRGRT